MRLLRLVRAAARVDQVGYALGEAKHAYLLGSAPGKFTVVDERGHTVREGRTGTSLGAGTRATRTSSTSICPLWTAPGPPRPQTVAPGG
jgi:hypothetical protein